MTTKVGLAVLLFSSVNVYAWTPHPSVPDETIEVTGSSIPGYMLVSEQSHEFKQITGGGGGGGAASPAEVNSSGTKKAEKAKEEEQKNGDPWFRTAALSAFSFFKSLTGQSFEMTGGLSRTTDKNGNTVDKAEFCLAWAKGSHNKDTCSKLDVKQRPDGKYFVEIKKLIAMEQGRNRWRLVYSTTDTISFLVDDPQEVVNVFHSIDPTL